MRRRLLVLTLVFVAVFVATYAATSLMRNAIPVAILITGAVGFLWMLAHDLRRRPLSTASQTGHDAAYAATVFAVLHGPGQGGADCPSGFDSSGGCGDAGM